MKRSTLYGAFLTLLMFWLVVVAIVVFLFQARSNLNDQVADLNLQNNGLSDSILDRDNQLATIQSEQALTTQDLATREAELVAAEAVQTAQATELDAQSDTIDSLNSDVGNAQATASALETAQDAARIEPPTVRLIAPTLDSELKPNEETLIIFSASDLIGVNLIALGINDETLLFEAEGETLATISVPWTPEEEGEYLISVSATDVDGQSSEAVEVMIAIVDEEALNNAIRADVEANVVEIRGLEPIVPVVPTLLTREELTARVNDDFFEDYTPADAADEALIYCAFDFAPCDFDLYNFILGFYSQGIAGFYDPETDEFVVISEGGVLNSSEQWTHAHEFMHALQDQYYNLEQISDDSVESEAAVAFRALAEGEATLIQLLYLPYFTPEEQSTLFEGSDGPDPFAGAPSIFQDQIFFPYNEGFEFVQALYDEGGFELIDETWQDPPTSSEHILHPERFLAGDEPLTVAMVPLSDTLGVDWRLIDEDSVGEFTMSKYLEQAVSTNVAAEAAEGWGGDRYAIYYNDETAELVLAMRTVWDTEADNDEFLNAYQLYGDAQFGSSFVPEDFSTAITCWQPEGGLTCLVSEDELTTTVIRAPSLELVQLIWDELQ